ncbi:MAG: translation initiation factor IF-2 [Spirochaetes bacterium]|nr:translation initiation factor IF-2 [Spirochaetota bacterium]
MTDGNDNEKAKPTLIKQPKAKPSEEREQEQDQASAEKKKIVVVKKKVVVKKPQARVVAHHEEDLPSDHAAPENAVQGDAPRAASAHSEDSTAGSVKNDAAPALADGSPQDVSTQEKPSLPQGTVGPKSLGQSPRTGFQGGRPTYGQQAGRPVPGQGVPAARPTYGQGGIDNRPQAAPVSPEGRPTYGQAPGARPSGENRPTGDSRPGGYTQGPRPTYGQGGDNRPGGSSQGSRPTYGQGDTRPGGYNQGGPGGPGRPGGYNQGGPGRPGGYNQGGPGRPGGYNQGGPGRPGGYNQGGPGRPGGYNQGGPGRPGGYNQGGPGGRPGYGGPGGRPGYGGPGGRPGYGGPGSKPGYGGRPGAPPAGEQKGPINKRFLKARKTSYVRKEEELTQKLLMAKKKAEALKANPIPKSIDILESISVADLARKMNLKPNELIGKLMKNGMMATINAQIDADTATLLAEEYGCAVRVVSLYDETVIEKTTDVPGDLEHRPPVVTVMGHVDHGKTKLLDAIRKTNVVASEFGGITQHIGAYIVETPKGRITFLDTPGHEAFTKMRARGSQITDIVVLVVAADDGVMPQTLEALDHAKAANVPVIVAINKIDLPEANPDRVKTQLSERGLIPEEWGGQTMFCEISALQKKGINELLDGILLQAEVLELTANYACRAEGKILEAKIDHGRGIVSTIIIERGSLRTGDCFVAGIFPGKVRALYDDRGQKLDVATPSMPVEVVGFEGMPNAGDPFESVEDEKYARMIAGKRQELKRYEDSKTVKKVTLDNLYDTIHQGNVQELNVIIKGDVTGSVEALKSSLEKLTTAEVRLTVIRSAAGAISEDDVNLASASNAIIIGFNVRPTPKAKILADQEKVDIRKYNIIYRVVEEIEKAMEGLLAPEYKDQDIGQVEVRETFKVPKIGIIAGCFVLEGAVKRSASVRVIREGIEIFSGKISSLKRFKDDAREVAQGYECGIGLENCHDLKQGDLLEVFEQVQISRKLT